ncbi:hypothetical protein MKX03_029270 [Papaver bracteatum]|nr:hypothetical protein MKX03_029270 [Papaver bracteatum]
MNALMDKRSPFCVSSARLDQVQKDLKKDLKDLSLCASAISLLGDVVPLPREEEWSATSSLRNLVEKEWRELLCASYAVHGILNSAVGATTRAQNILNVLEDGKVAYDIHKFDISSCNYTDLRGNEHRVDLDKLRMCNEDTLAAYSEKIIDGINKVKARRDALNAILRQFLVGGNPPSDVYLLSIDRKGIEVLAEYCIKLPAKDEYIFDEHRLEFEVEMNDAEEFCRLLIQLEDELIIHSYQGSIRAISKTNSGVCA